jgi:hypothetical protein
LEIVTLAPILVLETQTTKDNKVISNDTETTIVTNKITFQDLHHNINHQEIMEVSEETMAVLDQEVQEVLAVAHLVAVVVSVQEDLLAVAEELDREVLDNFKKNNDNLLC